MHVDRVVGHRQVSATHPYPVALRHHQGVDVGEDPAIPRPEVEVRHLHDSWDEGARVDVVGGQEEGKVPVNRHERRIARVHDEEAHHAHRHLHHLVRVRVVHEGA